MTRPDISYVQILSRYIHRNYKSHLNIAFRLLRYLKESLIICVHITKNDFLSLVGFVDAD